MSVATVITGILKMLLPADDPTLIMRDIVLDERAKQQKNKLISIREHLGRIERYSEHNAVESDRMMLNLYGSLDTERCLYMRRDGIQSCAKFFIQFATIYLANCAVNRDAKL